MGTIKIDSLSMVEESIKDLFENGYLRHRNSFLGWRNGKSLIVGVAVDSSSINIVGDFEHDMELKAKLTKFYASRGLYTDFSRVGNTYFMKLYRL